MSSAANRPAARLLNVSTGILQSRCLNLQAPDRRKFFPEVRLTVAKPRMRSIWVSFETNFFQGYGPHWRTNTILDLS